MPELLIDLIPAGKGGHPGDTRMREVIPFLVDGVRFLPTHYAMTEFWYRDLADDPKESSAFRLVHGSKVPGPIELPWLDVDESFFVAVNRVPGDDVAIALDYRTDWEDPRVVASEWGVEGSVGIVWREVAPTFSDFVRRLGLGSPSSGRQTF